MTLRAGVLGLMPAFAGVLAFVPAFAGVLAFMPAFALAAAPPPPCPPLSDSSDDTGSLPHLAATLRPGATLEVLAVGSGVGPAPTATMPPAAPAPAHASPTMKSPTAKAPVAKVPAAKSPAQSADASAGLPWQLALALEGTVRGLQVNVTAIGHRFLTAEEMLPLLRAELPKKPYRLLVWQTGTVDAVNSVPPDDFSEALADGAAAAANEGADLVLIDPQWSRFLEANANLAPYEEAMQAAAALPGVMLFHRLDIMRDWADQDAIDLERTPKASRPAVAARLHECLGQNLAQMLLRDVASGP